MLYLQADNCWRENKNHCLLCYLGWLVERGVFKRIELSYFCVGHTHFGPDQVASRISLCARCHDIPDREENARILRGAYSPELDFEHLDDVVNCQDTWFPHKSAKGQRSYAKCNGSAMKKLNLISTVRHFQISMGVDEKAGPEEPKTRVVYRIKPDAESAWSAPANLFWHSPSGLDDKEFGPSLVKTPEQTIKAVEEAERGLAAVRERVSKESYDRCLYDIEKLRNPVSIPFHWEDGGRFKKELLSKAPEQVRAFCLLADGETFLKCPCRLQDEGVVVEDVVPDNQCASSKYKSVNQWATARAREGHIAIGSMVLFTECVSEKNPTKERWVVAAPDSAPSAGPLW